KLIRAFDAVMTRIPIVRLVYSATRQVLNALRISRETPFNRVVIVEFPRRGMQSIAFVTGKAIDVDGEKKFPLYVPTAPNPTSGYLVMMPASEITGTDITVEEALSMVVSSGLLMPRKIKVTST
ncbi:MAG: DUF502 domain-containing protein, partial [Dehalococcoidia bacterium]|nr:DUF502 domain-containing protein [Dehalococcoidia bacterium]